VHILETQPIATATIASTASLMAYSKSLPFCSTMTEQPPRAEAGQEAGE
jgi:hypothetical protein